MLEPWKEVKQTFLAGTIIFLVFIIVSYNMAPSYKLSELSTHRWVLAKDPMWMEKHSKGGSYWIELYFKGEDERYEIDGIDYKYLNHKAFRNSIRKGDLLTIGTRGNNIFTLTKNGIDYLNFDNAQYHKERNRLFAKRLFFTGLIFCFIPLFFNSYLSFTILGKNVPVRFGWILLIGMTIAFLILCKQLGFQYVSGAQFVK